MWPHNKSLDIFPQWHFEYSHLPEKNITQREFRSSFQISPKVGTLCKTSVMTECKPFLNQSLSEHGTKTPDEPDVSSKSLMLPTGVALFFFEDAPLWGAQNAARPRRNGVTRSTILSIRNPQIPSNVLNPLDCSFMRWWTFSHPYFWRSFITCNQWTSSPLECSNQMLLRFLQLFQSFVAPVPTCLKCVVGGNIMFGFADWLDCVADNETLIHPQNPKKVIMLCYRRNLVIFNSNLLSRKF